MGSASNVPIKSGSLGPRGPLGWGPWGWGPWVPGGLSGPRGGPWGGPLGGGAPGGRGGPRVNYLTLGAQGCQLAPRASRTQGSIIHCRGPLGFLGWASRPISMKFGRGALHCVP